MSEKLIQSKRPIETTSKGVKLRQYGELDFSARVKDTGASIFLNGRYPAPIQALIELTDNSFGHRKRDQGTTTISVDLEQDRDKVRVSDSGGLGTDAEGIKSFTRLGQTTSVGIGYRGAGAKFATWYFGNDIEIHAKKEGESVEHSTKIEGFGDPTVEYKGTFPIDTAPTNREIAKGRFDVIIRRLKHPEQLPSRGALKKVLGEVYRPLLAKKQEGFSGKSHKILPRIIVDSDGNYHQIHDSVHISVSKKREGEVVEPLSIPLLPQYSEDKIAIAETSKGEKMWFW